MMRHPIVIEEGSEPAAFGVVVPDLRGCFSAGDTLDEAVAAAGEAAAAWIDTALDAGATIPLPSRLEEVGHLPQYQGWTIAAIDVDSHHQHHLPGR